MKLTNFLKFSIRRFGQFSNPLDYYAILSLTSSASQAEIKTAYINLAKKLHPDMPNGDENQFKLVAEAYEVLGNPDTRQEYDSKSSKSGSKGSKGSKSQENAQKTENDTYSTSRNHKIHKSAQEFKPKSKENS